MSEPSLMEQPDIAVMYRDALLNDIVPFWLTHSLDRECGGYFTCLDRNGTVYDTDKFLWLQAREVWMFSALYNRLDARAEWLDAARLGADFLRAHGRSPDGGWYFSLTRDGRPLVQPYNVFSDCFAAMASSEFARAADDDGARSIAAETHAEILRKQDAPKGQWEKSYPGTRPMKSLALPMILANVTTELGWMLDPAIVEETLDACVSEVFGVFLDAGRGIMRESIAPDGSHVDSFDGRLINPGHGIEAMWFMLDIADRREDAGLARQAVDVIVNTLEFGWDREHDGIFYFLDVDGHPPDKLEWDQKLWWVHLEALVALLKGFRITGDERCRRWFNAVHDYAWSHFPDPDHGEWYGYLKRQGEPLLTSKGGKWKGCFHVPRALWLCSRELELIAKGL